MLCKYYSKCKVHGRKIKIKHERKEIMTTIKCKNCGADMPENVKFCGSCGGAAEAVMPAPPAEPAPIPPAPPVIPAPAPVTPAPAPVAPAPAPVTPAPAPVAPPPYIAPAAPPAPDYSQPVSAVAPGVPAGGGFAQTSASIGSSIAVNVKKYAKFGIIGIAAIVVLITLIIVLTPSQYDRLKGIVRIIPQHENGIVTIIPHGKEAINIEGYLRGSAVSLDGTKAAVLIEDDYSNGNVLYFITDKIQLVSDEVVAFWFAASGNGIAYTLYEPEPETNWDSWDWEREWQRTWNRTAELWHFADGKARRITSDFFMNGSCVLSPDGKILAYTTVSGSVDNDNIRHTGIVWNGKENELGRDVFPVAVANGAKYIYLNRGGNDGRTLWVQRGFNENNRERLGDNVHSVFFNRDLSQAVFASNSRSFISINGGQREPLSGMAYGLIVPANTATHYSWGDTSYTIYGVRNFANTFYYNSDSALVRINNKYEAESIVRNIDMAYLANDGKTLTYISSRNNNIFRIDGLRKDAEGLRITDRYTEYFIPTNDGSAIFFIDEDGDIYYQKGSSRAVSVSNDFSFSWWWGSVFALHRGNTLFYISNSELNSSTGARGRRISGLDGDIVSVEATMFDMVVRTSEGGNTMIYHSTDGQRFKLIGTISTGSDFWGGW
jgi:hypothetical protein